MQEEAGWDTKQLRTFQIRELSLTAAENRILDRLFCNLVTIMTLPEC